MENIDRNQNDTDKLAAYLLRCQTRLPSFAISQDPKVSILVIVNTTQWLDLYHQVAHIGLQFGIEPEIIAMRKMVRTECEYI